MVADEADRWLEELPQRYPPSRLLNAALEVFRTVNRDAKHLVNQDLHGGNVLRAGREPWLVIDPKPLVGEREIDGVGLLRNADDPARWLDALTELGYDRERLWGWGFAHALAWDDRAKAEMIYRNEPLDAADLIEARIDLGPVATGPPVDDVTVMVTRPDDVVARTRAEDICLRRCLRARRPRRCR